MSLEEQEMEVDDYIDMQTARIDRHYEMLDRIEEKRKRKSESAKKAAITRNAVALDKEVLKKKREYRELENLILSKRKILSFVDAVSFADSMMYGTEKPPFVNAMQAEIYDLTEKYKVILEEIKETEREALKRVQQKTKELLSEKK
jgi:hypothetical protein